MDSKNNFLEGESKKAYDKAIVFLTRNDRTEHEVREKLSKSGYSESITQAVIDKLLEYGYVDDEDYAKRYLEHLIGKGKGRFSVRESMIRKGLPSELVTFTIEDEYSKELEYEIAEKIALTVLSGLDENEDKAKVSAKINRRLMGRGFAYDVISDVMNEIRNQIEGMKNV